MRRIGAVVLLMLCGGLLAWPAPGFSAPAHSAADPASVYLPLVIRVEPVVVTILSNDTAFRTSSGSVHVLGEVLNQSGWNLGDVLVSAALLNSQGNVLQKSETYIALDVLPAQGKTCFDITFLDPPSNWESYAFGPVTYKINAVGLPNLAILSAFGYYHSKDGTYSLEGTIRNDQGSRVECVRPVGTLFTASGKVVGCEYNYVDSIHLYAGQSSAFHIDYYRRDYKDVTAFSIQVHGDPH